jgi:EmrB/QacA subfamily drug resistance transporter
MPSSILSPPRHAAGRSRWADRPSVFLLVILAAQLMVVLDTTIVNVALPHIQRGLGFSSSGLSWVLNAYILTFGGLLLLGARAGDLLGRRRSFLAGIAVFSVSSLLGGIAPAGWVLLSARAVQGIGAAFAAPAALSLLTAVFPEGRERVRAIGLYTTVSAAGGAIGLVAGGLLTQLLSWRWVMFVNVPIGLAIWLLGRVVVVETEQRHGRFDFIGAVTSTLGMTSIVYGLVEAGSKGWGDPVTVGSFAAGLALLAAFVFTERRVEEPILPLRLLANPTRTAANLARGLVYAGMYGLFFFLSQFLQDVQGYTPLRTGVAFLPMPAAVFLASQLTSRVLVRRLPDKIVMTSGILLATFGMLLATRVSAVSSYGQIVMSLVLLGAGAGISFVSLTTASLHEVAPADAGAASGIINVAQQLGAAVGLAVLVTIFDTVTHHAHISAGIAGSTNFIDGLRVVFWVGALFTFAALTVVTSLVRTASAVTVEATNINLDTADLEVDADSVWLAEPADVA